MARYPEVETGRNPLPPFPLFRSRAREALTSAARRRACRPLRGVSAAGRIRGSDGRPPAQRARGRGSRKACVRRTNIVAQRTPEIGVRIALGACGRDVMMLVMRDATAGSAAVALLAGYVPAWRASRVDPMLPAVGVGEDDLVGNRRRSPVPLSPSFPLFVHARTRGSPRQREVGGRRPPRAFHHFRFSLAPAQGSPRRREVGRAGILGRLRVAAFRGSDGRAPVGL